MPTPYYIVYKYLGMTPSGTIVVLLLFFFFIFLVFPCFILLFVLVICAFFRKCMFLMELSLLIKNLNLYKYFGIRLYSLVWLPDCTI